MRATRAERLGKLVQLTEARESARRVALGRALGELSAAETREQDLLSYRNAESARRLQAVRPGAVFIDSRQFFDKLNAAIEAQREIVAARRFAVDKARAAWLRERQRAELLRNVANRARDAEQAARQRAEQKALDEVAQQIYTRGERV